MKTAIDIGYDTHYVIRVHNGNNFSFASIDLSFPSDIQSQENTTILLRSLGSAGGMDILSIIILKKFSVRLGTTSLVSNAVLMLTAISRIPLEMILYTLIYIYVSAYFVNLVVTGLNQRKAVMIVSDQWQLIAKEIMGKMGRGVTVVHGEGGYSGKEQKILYSVISFQELARFKNLIRKVDPEAFVVITETLEVMGQKIGNQPHW